LSIGQHGGDPHSHTPDLGENISWFADGGTEDEAVPGWYEEKKDYNFQTGQSYGMTGHFTQLVWKGSKRLGVGIAKRGREVWVVANYSPPGNWPGHQLQNVFPE